MMMPYLDTHCHRQNPSKKERRLYKNRFDRGKTVQHPFFPSLAFLSTFFFPALPVFIFICPERGTKKFGLLWTMNGILFITQKRRIDDDDRIGRTKDKMLCPKISKVGDGAHFFAPEFSAIKIGHFLGDAIFVAHPIR